jgi:hypothetical protein
MPCVNRREVVGEAQQLTEQLEAALAVHGKAAAPPRFQALR